MPRIFADVSCQQRLAPPAGGGAAGTQFHSACCPCEPLLYFFCRHWSACNACRACAYLHWLRRGALQCAKSASWYAASTTRCITLPTSLVAVTHTQSLPHPPAASLTLSRCLTHPLHHPHSVAAQPPRCITHALPGALIPPCRRDATTGYVRCSD